MRLLLKDILTTSCARVSFIISNLSVFWLVDGLVCIGQVYGHVIDYLVENIIWTVGLGVENE